MGWSAGPVGPAGWAQWAWLTYESWAASNLLYMVDLLSMHFGQVLHGWTGGLGLIQGYCSINFWHHTSAYDFVSRFYYTLTPPLSMSGLGMFLVNLLRSGPWGFFILFRSICPCLRLLTWLPATVYPTYYWLYYAPLKMHSL